MIIKKYSNETEFRKDKGYKGKLNLFFSENYQKYCTKHHAKNKEYCLFSSENFVIPVLIRKFGLFTSATLMSEPCKYADNDESQKDFINAVCRYLNKKEHVKWIPQTETSSFFDEYPDGAKVIRFGSYVIDLSKDEDEIFNNLNKSFRTGIRRALKGGVIVKIGGKELIPDFCVIETEMWKRSNISLNHKDDTFYPDLFQAMGENVAVGIAYKDDCPQVGLVIYYNLKAAYCMLAGRISKNEPGSNNLLYWEMIQYMKSIGVEEFVIVGYRLKLEKGSKLYNIQKFKDDFGAELRTGFMFKITFSRFHAKMYGLLLKAVGFAKTRKLSFKKSLDIIDQEIHKWPEYND